MERRQLEYFVAVVEHGGIGRAAAALHLSQPALSRAIQGLEDELDTVLFRRTRGGVVPTQTAQRLVRQARAVLRGMEEFGAMAHATGKELIGKVRVAVTPGPSAEMLARIVAALQARHPGIHIVAEPADGPDDAAARVVDGRSDVALFGARTQPAVAPLRTQDAGVDELVVALPPGSSLIARAAVRYEDLRGVPMVLAPYAVNMKRFVDELHEATGGLRVVAEVSHRHAVLTFVAHGIGAGIVSGTATATASALGVALRPFDPPELLHTWVCHQSAMSVQTRAFVAAARGLTSEADSARGP